MRTSRRGDMLRDYESLDLALSRSSFSGNGSVPFSTAARDASEGSPRGALSPALDQRSFSDLWILAVSAAARLSDWHNSVDLCEQNSSYANRILVMRTEF